jgi:hypothetical protein
MNQYRCEICKLWDYHCPLSGGKIKSLENVIEAMAIVGCASHSDFQSERQPDRISCIHMQVCKFQTCTELCDYYCSLNSEREKVLDELLKRAKARAFRVKVGCVTDIDDLEKDAEELRQQAGDKE